MIDGLYLLMSLSRHIGIVDLIHNQCYMLNMKQDVRLRDNSQKQIIFSAHNTLQSGSHSISPTDSPHQYSVTIIFKNMMKKKKTTPNPVPTSTPKPRPQFSTDFIDRDKYKLTQAQMIQKKASLQSKHRQEAIIELQQRREKLQMGIVDDDTRKVYETALTAKNIDLNPSVRKYSQSEMIQYERERAPLRNEAKKEEDFSEDGDEEDDEIERQLREAQAFIKKFQRAKKTDKIERAVDILTAGEKPREDRLAQKAYKPKDNQMQPQNMLFENEKITAARVRQEPNQDPLNTTQEDVLSSIEDTIRFMEERLFSAGGKRNTQTQQSSPLKEQQNREHTSPRKAQPEEMQISGLELRGDDWEGGQCLETIRRVREMMDGGGKSEQNSPFKLKENSDRCNILAEEQIAVPIFDKRNCHYADSQAEVDFSLTLNHSAMDSSSALASPKHNNKQTFEDLQQQLTNQVQKLQMHSFSTPSPIAIQNSAAPLSSGVAFSPPPTNPQLAKLKEQIKGNQASVQTMKVQPLKMGKPGVMGMDFRGSFNIRKNTTSQLAS